LSSLSIKPTDVGKRVTVQYFDDDGSRHEVVGFLERAEVHEGKAVLHIRCRDDSLVSVPLNRIRAGRVVPASSR
jgi:hypothetical protein